MGIIRRTSIIVEPLGASTEYNAEIKTNKFDIQPIDDIHRGTIDVHGGDIRLYETEEQELPGKAGQVFAQPYGEYLVDKTRSTPNWSSVAINGQGTLVQPTMPTKTISNLNYGSPLAYPQPRDKYYVSIPEQTVHIPQSGEKGIASNFRTRYYNQSPTGASKKYNDFFAAMGEPKNPIEHQNYIPDFEATNDPTIAESHLDGDDTSMISELFYWSLNSQDEIDKKQPRFPDYGLPPLITPEIENITVTEIERESFVLSPEDQARVLPNGLFPFSSFNNITAPEYRVNMGYSTTQEELTKAQSTLANLQIQ